MDHDNNSLVGIVGIYHMVHGDVTLSNNSLNFFQFDIVFQKYVQPVYSRSLDKKLANAR